jgi:cob(I)alamin adenosyltransferase
MELKQTALFSVFLFSFELSIKKHFLKKNLMESTNSNIDLFNKECYICTEEFNRFRSSVSKCSQCDYSLCSECILIHRKKHEQDIVQIQDQYNELINRINEKEKYINDTSNESIEIVVNWYQRLINDLIESQTQIIENIQNERDRARDELAQFDTNIHLINKDIQQINENTSINSIQTKLNDLATKLSNYQITKDIYLPDSHTFQPRYKVFYQFKNSSLVEEDWDIDTNEAMNIPLPSHLSLTSSHTTTTTTTPLFFSDTSQTFVTPKDEDDEENNFQWHEEIEEINDNNSEYLLDPRLYHLGTSRHFNSDIHLIASNGNDLLLVNNSKFKITKLFIF